MRKSGHDVGARRSKEVKTALTAASAARTHMLDALTRTSIAHQQARVEGDTFAFFVGLGLRSKQNCRDTSDMRFMLAQDGEANMSAVEPWSFRCLEQHEPHSIGTPGTELA